MSTMDSDPTRAVEVVKETVAVWPAVAAALLIVIVGALGFRCENLTVPEPEGFPAFDSGSSASEEALQRIELKAGSIFARSSPDGLLTV